MDPLDAAGDSEVVKVSRGNRTAQFVDPNDPNATYIALAGQEDLVHLVRGNGQIQEVHVTDEQGNVQEITYHYSTGEGQAGQFALQAEQDQDPADDQDPSYEYYDNVRGKVNINLLEKLVQKNRAEDVTLTKQSRLDRWTDVTSEYANVTGQTKSRTALMKRFSSVKYYRSHEGKPVSEGGRVKGCFKKSSTDDSTGKDVLRKSIMVKQFKEYDALRLESARMQKNACKVELENSLLENEALKKENAILDLQLEAARLQMALIQDEANRSKNRD